MKKSRLFAFVVILLALLAPARAAFFQADAALAAGETDRPVFLPMVSTSGSDNKVYGVEMTQIAPETGLTKVSDAGTTWIRRNIVYWSEIEPVRGQRNWEWLAGLEQELAYLSGSKIQPILIVRKTPDWARQNPNSICGPVKPENLADFASFMHDLVSRYSTKYGVRYYELWNEPDVFVHSFDFPFGCWGNRGDPNYGGAYYADMLKQVYPAIKAADPEAQVLLGGLLLDCDPRNPPETSPGSGQKSDCTASKYLEGILKNGGGPYFDVVSFHAYDYYGGQMDSFENRGWSSAWNTTGPTVLTKLSYLRGLLEKYGQADKPLMNTEVALLCDSNCDNTFEVTKAHYLTKAYAIAIAEGLKANIWYDDFGGWRNSGLFFTVDSPRPAYYAYVFSYQKLGSARFVQEVTIYPGVKIYEFSLQGERLWVVWSSDGNTHSLPAPGAPLSAWDSLGKSLTFGDTISIGPAPLYLQW